MISGGRRGIAVLVAGCMPLAACKSGTPSGPPPRASDTIQVPAQDSVIAVPVTADLSGLARQLEAEIPRQLWTIDERGQTCVPSERIKVAFVKLKTPTLKCDISGTVTRGALTLSGRGQDIVVTMPIRAVVRAKDIGGILKQETATANAQVRAVARLSLDDRWNPRATMNIEYDWTDAPHVDFLGQRIEFTNAADSKLKGIVARLERTLPRELAKLNLRADIERLWGQAFTSLQLNRANPPVWMRITPQQLQYGGYTINGRRLELRLGMKARTETFVGDRPEDPARTPLPPLARLAEAPGKLMFFVPVIADYDELEPVIARALVKRSARPFEVPGIGLVDAKFGAVEAYGSTKGRVAVGVTFTAKQREGNVGSAKGRIWLTGVPVNRPGSREVGFSQVEITGDTDRADADLLLALANSPGFSQTIGGALAQNFERDYDELMRKVATAIESKREGDLLIRARIEDVRTGKLKAAGQGLYLPVWGTGTADIRLAPS